MIPDRQDGPDRGRRLLGAARMRYRYAVHRTRHRRKDAADRLLDPYATLFVAPSEIRMPAYTDELAQTNFEHGVGRVLDGEWDLNTVSFAETLGYRALEDLLTGRRPWQETELYERVRQAIAQGRSWWGCRTMADFDRRARYIADLHDSIRARGYLARADLARSNAPGGSAGDIDEVLVAIGRDGDFVFLDGQHRLAIALLLGLSRIPVQVGVRHPGWMDFRSALREYALGHGGTVAQPLTHPDLCGMPAAEPWGSVGQLVVRAVGERAETGLVLVVGARWGYLCHVLEEGGHESVAVEDEELDVWFLMKLRRSQRRRFLVSAGSFTRAASRPAPRPDVVVAVGLGEAGPRRFAGLVPGVQEAGLEAAVEALGRPPVVLLASEDRPLAVALQGGGYYREARSLGGLPRGETLQELLPSQAAGRP